MSLRQHFWFRCIGTPAIVFVFAGCAVVTSSLSTSNNPGPQAVSTPHGLPPLVQDCGIVGISSPTKYVCDGKVYTSVELARLREDWAKNQAAGSPAQ